MIHLNDASNVRTPQLWWQEKFGCSNEEINNLHEPLLPWEWLDNSTRSKVPSVLLRDALLLHHRDRMVIDTKAQIHREWRRLILSIPSFGKGGREGGRGLEVNNMKSSQVQLFRLNFRSGRNYSEATDGRGKLNCSAGRGAEASESALQSSPEWLVHFWGWNL